MTLHNALTGVELHETKGAAAATKGHLLVASGAATAVYQALLGNVVHVNALADLPTAAAGKITLLANTSYLFGASVNIGTDFLQFSAGSSIQSMAAFTSTVTYTGTAPMLQGADANTRIKDINLLCANSDLFDWEDTGGGGSSIIIMTDVLVIACKAVGVFDDIGTLVIDGMTVVSCTTGIKYLGVNANGTRLSSLNLISTSTTFIGLDFTGATIGNVNIDGIVMSGGAGSIGMKGDGNSNILANRIANVENIQFQGVTTPLVGITIDDFRWNFQQNGDLADTMPDALTGFVSNATVTTLSVGVPTLVAGTFVGERASQYTTTAAGRATYNGERDLVTPIDVTLTIDPASGTNKSIRAFIALNGTAITASGIAVNISNGDPKIMTIPWQLNLSENDFVEVFIENETDSVNATVVDCTLRLR